MNTIKKAAFVLALISAFSACVWTQENSNPEKENVELLIGELYKHPWRGAVNTCSPMCWDFSFTEPMDKILAVGGAAQEALLEKLDDERIKDQVILLLGGVGDERAVGPIIRAMICKKASKKTTGAEKTNLSADLALTNITVSEVIWHHGGGIESRRCRENSRECWEKWWKKNKSSFTVKGVTASRRYSNYPNYGIYRQK